MAVKPLKISTDPEVFTGQEVGSSENIGVGGVDFGDTGNIKIWRDGDFLKFTDIDSGTTYTLLELYTGEASPLAGTTPVIFFYGGNANNGRVLEYIPAESSDDAPFISIADGVLRGISFGAAAVATDNTILGVYENGDLVTPIYECDVSNLKKRICKPITIMIHEADEIMVKIDSGSVNKPYAVLYIQTS